MKKKVTVVVSKIKEKNPKTHKPPPPKKKVRQLQPYKKLRNISVADLRIETRHHS